MKLKVPRHEITLMRPEDDQYSSAVKQKDMIINEPKLKVSMNDQQSNMIVDMIN